MQRGLTFRRRSDRRSAPGPRGPADAPTSVVRLLSPSLGVLDPLEYAFSLTLNGCLGVVEKRPYHSLLEKDR
jgi:hypothetical protein